MEESEVIKAIKEEYEKKLVEKEKEISILTENFNKEKENLREEHIKQIRTLIRTGGVEIPEAEEEKDEVELEVERLKNKYAKK